MSLKNSKSYYHASRKSTSQRLVEALQALGPDTWHGTKEIAKQMGRDKVFISDRGALERLVQTGVLELRQVPAPVNPRMTRYEYRIADLSRLSVEEVNE